jgi:hypothetical protein
MTQQEIDRAVRVIEGSRIGNTGNAAPGISTETEKPTITESSMECLVFGLVWFGMGFFSAMVFCMILHHYICE